MGSTFRRESSSPHPFLFLLLAVFVGEFPNNRPMVTRCFQIVITFSFKLTDTESGLDVLSLYFLCDALQGFRKASVDTSLS